MDGSIGTRESSQTLVELQGLCLYEGTARANLQALGGISRQRIFTL